MLGRENLTEAEKIEIKRARAELKLQDLLK